MKKQSKKGSFVRFKRNSATISIFTYSVTLLVVKLLWLNAQEGRGLLGADGENYLEALGGLWKDGFFSNQGKLSYWPAGYPILMWPIAELSLNNLAFNVGAIQSAIFAICVSFFCVEISKSSLRRFTWPTMHLLNLSPTLSLNSAAIGYEVTSAVIFLLVIGLYLRQIRLKKNSVFNFENFLASFALAVSCFMQPRMILLAMGILIPFAIYHFRFKLIPGFLILSLAIVSFAPGVLIFRNIKAQGFVAVSTNLGTTMNIGAGPKSTGGYTNQATGVPCDPVEGNAAERDSHLLGCVIKWYLDNPIPTGKLLVNKFVFHWSPWFGPLANGTMARNPWRDFHPFAAAESTPSGERMVNGVLGKTVSWIWLLGTLALLINGFLALRRRGGISTLLAWSMFIPVLLNTASSMGTIGDHRFRIPTLTLSILLQLFGLYAILERRLFKRGLDGNFKLAQGLNWKGRGQGDNLQP